MSLDVNPAHTKSRGSTPAPVRRALISVSDKRGLVDFAKGLKTHGIEILSTGGSARSLREGGLDVLEVSDYTGFPEIMDGRVKTLHPKVHGGILARRDLKEHVDAMADHGIGPIDLVVINLYPFEATLASGADFQTCIENIDIGGPAMVRASAKNHEFVGVVTDPEDYGTLLDELSHNDGCLTPELRLRLAAKAFGHTAFYDAVIARWLERERGETFPGLMTIPGRRSAILRYGENPHQKAAFYHSGDKRPGIANARQIQGKELSYNNLNDTNAAFELVGEFEDPGVAIIKHANPCGVSIATSLLEAYERALATDPVSAFGGIIALNRPLDRATADEIQKLFVEVVIAPGCDPDALEIMSKKPNVRLLVTEGLPDPAAEAVVMTQTAGGFLAQTRDNGRISKDDLKVVTKRAPSEAELNDLLFAFRVAKHVKSNTIVYAKSGATVGIGAGQMSRVDAARIAARKAQDAAEAAGLTEPMTRGSVAASDAFFPFADGLLTTVEAGASAVIQPGGSLRDDEVIAAADDAGLAMVFTGMRHFRH
ncbi:MAG: bifunctional phosphoribosylaminoimidazolecarboxamide formyltransferase/IMP cyclohydrolase [Kiloniellales bacterium]|nr:bifunctional phosphoribosylaminoimidazolecarboxamide formyltransferase/IMP cyclohydrolase [Kiloniellales bacterium]